MYGGFEVFKAYLAIKLHFTTDTYNYDEYGITSNYQKYSKNWWKKRNEAFDYLKMLNKKMNKVNKIGPDYYLTKFINLFI